MESFERQSNGVMRTERHQIRRILVKECYGYKRVSKMSVWEQESGPERGMQR